MITTGPVRIEFPENPDLQQIQAVLRRQAAISRAAFDADYDQRQAERDSWWYSMGGE